ncbi:MAG: hypothetical protein HWN65_16180 [Candidatus Helarchaeota archaeon]|nr:hypothetical protein [Candidatus Helarchaeota archaeon]
MKKPYLLPVIGFIGYFCLEFVHLILFALTSSKSSVFLLHFDFFTYNIYPYLLPIFQILLLIGFLIFYLESRRKFALVVLILGINSIFLNGYGFHAMRIAFAHDYVQLFRLTYILTPLLTTLPLSICMGIGFILINHSSTPRTNWSTAAAFGLIFSGILMYFLNITRFVSGEPFNPPFERYLGLKITILLFAISFLLMACIGGVRSFMKLKLNRTSIVPLEQPGFRFKVRGITILILLAFITIASIIGLIIVFLNKSPFAITNAIIFSQFLAFLAIYGTKALLDGNYIRIFSLGLVFQGFLSYMLGIILMYLHFTSWSVYGQSVVVLTMVLFGIGFITSVIFPWFATVTIQQIEPIDMRKVVRFSLWCNIPLITIFPATVIVLGLFGLGPFPYYSYSSIIYIQLILFFCTFLIPTSIMLYYAHRFRMSFRTFLMQFSKPLLQLSGWIFVGIAIFSCISSSYPAESIPATLLLVVACNFAIFTHLNLPKNSYWIFLLSIPTFILSLIFLRSSILVNSILIIGLIFSVLAMNHSTLMLINKIEWAPPQVQPTTPQIPKPPPKIPQKPPPRLKLIISDELKDTLSSVVLVKKTTETIQTLRVQKEKLMQRVFLNEITTKEYKIQLKRIERDIFFYKGEKERLGKEIDTPIMNMYMRLTLIGEVLEDMAGLLTKRKIHPKNYEMVEKETKFEQKDLRTSLYMMETELVSKKSTIQKAIENLQSQKIALFSELKISPENLSDTKLKELQTRYHKILQMIDTYQTCLIGIDILRTEMRK